MSSLTVQGLTKAFGTTPVLTGVEAKALVRAFTVRELMWSDLVGHRGTAGR